MRIVLTEKARWLQSQPDIEHVIVVPSDRDTTTSLFGSTLYSTTGPGVPASPGYHLLIRPGRLREIIEQEQPDVIELGSVYAAPWLLRYAASRSNARQVGFFHMDLRGVVLRQLPNATPGFLRGAASAVLSAYLRAAYRRCDRVIAASRAAQRALGEAGIVDTELVPLGVDTELFHPRCRDPHWRIEVRVEDDRPIGLYVGRLSTEKGVRFLIDALPDLHRATGLKLVLIGDGHLRPELQGLTAKHPEMLVVKPYETDRERLARAYASADIYFAPFPHETFGLAAVEAAASGLPVVGVNSGAIADVLEGADWGRTYAPDDVSGLVEAARALLDEDSAWLRDAARGAAEQYSWDRTFSRMVQIYREVTGTT